MKEKTMNPNSVKIRRKFHATFKREAVRNWLNSGQSAPNAVGTGEFKSPVPNSPV